MLTGLNINDPNKSFRETLAEISNKIEKKDMEDLALIWWCIWHQRNKTLFD